MTIPIALRELSEQGPFTDAGPHRVATGIPVPSTLRAGVNARVLIKDTGTGDLVYDAMVRWTLYAANTFSSATITEIYAAVGWSGNVLIDPAVDAGEAVADVLVPTGYTIEISYQLEGVST